MQLASSGMYVTLVVDERQEEKRKTEKNVKSLQVCQFTGEHCLEERGYKRR